MNNSKSAVLALCFLIFGLTLAACGQKGPIEVDRTPVVQEDAPEETK